jgi:hypothetical protein
VLQAKAGSDCLIVNYPDGPIMNEVGTQIAPLKKPSTVWIDGLLVDDLAASADRAKDAEQQGRAFQHAALK